MCNLLSWRCRYEVSYHVEPCLHGILSGNRDINIDVSDLVSFGNSKRRLHKLLKRNVKVRKLVD